MGNQKLLIRGMEQKIKGLEAEIQVMRAQYMRLDAADTQVTLDNSVLHDQVEKLKTQVSCLTSERDEKVQWIEGWKVWVKELNDMIGQFARDVDKDSAHLLVVSAELRNRLAKLGDT
jgi:hypothetical protein